MRYELELWVNGELAADVSALARNRQFSLRRNFSEELIFTMNLSAFERLCSDGGIDPAVALEENVTDVRVKLDGEYLFGTQVKEAPIVLSSETDEITIRATGFLDLFQDRYITQSYADSERVAIFRDLIATSQSGTYNDWGVIAGPAQYATDITDTVRNYVDHDVRNALVNLTSLADGNFDFRFNADRSYETFEMIGEDRTYRTLIYPVNVASASLTRTARSQYNYIIAKGSGIGEETLTTITADAESRSRYGTRQHIVLFNSVSEQQTLDINAAAYLRKYSQLLRLPTLKLSPGAFVLGRDISIGDRIACRIDGHPFAQVDGTYRVEQIDVSLDDNDFESISVKVDDLGL